MGAPGADLIRFYLAISAAGGFANRARGGEMFRDAVAGVEFFLPDGMTVRRSTPSRLELSGDSSEVFSVVLVVEVVKPEEDEDLDSLFDDLRPGLERLKVIKGWLCGQRLEQHGKRSEDRVVGRCARKGPGKSFTVSSVRATPEDYRNLGGLTVLQRVSASVHTIGKRK